MANLQTSHVTCVCASSSGFCTFSWRCTMTHLWTFPMICICTRISELFHRKKPRIPPYKSSLIRLCEVSAVPDRVLVLWMNSFVVEVVHCSEDAGCSRLVEVATGRQTSWWAGTHWEAPCCAMTNDALEAEMRALHASSIAGKVLEGHYAAGLQRSLRGALVFQCNGRNIIYDSG